MTKAPENVKLTCRKEHVFGMPTEDKIEIDARRDTFTVKCPEKSCTSHAVIPIRVICDYLGIPAPHSTKAKNLAIRYFRGKMENNRLVKSVTEQHIRADEAEKATEMAIRERDAAIAERDLAKAALKGTRAKGTTPTLPACPTVGDELAFIRNLATSIPGNARLHEMFSPALVGWVQETLMQERRPQSNPGMDGSLDIMGLWSMVNRERNEALTANSLLRTIVKQNESHDCKCKTKDVEVKIPYPAITVHSGAPDFKQIAATLKTASEIHVTLVRSDDGGAEYAITSLGEFPSPIGKLFPRR